MDNIAYLGMDIHASFIVMGKMNNEGEFLGNQSFTTSEKNIIANLEAVKEPTKYLTFEESTLAYWAAQVSRPYVTEVIICDPKENALIFKGSQKNDKIDTRKLCRLLRIGELKKVYHPTEDHRAIFKATVQHYIDLRNQVVSLKQKIKAMFRHWGVIDVAGDAVYKLKKRDEFIKQVKHVEIRKQLKHLYALMDKTESLKDSAKKNMKKLGRNYPEIKEFKKMPGIGDVGAHVFDAYIQTPHRFKNKRRVCRYCRLAITERNSAGKPLGYKRLDRSGVSELKALSYRAWMSSMKGDNEVKRFYQKSLQRTHDHVHARLNTQRKIIAVMYSVWKKGDAYRPELFLDPSK